MPNKQHCFEAATFKYLLILFNLGIFSLISEIKQRIEKRKWTFFTLETMKICILLDILQSF